MGILNNIFKKNNSKKILTTNAANRTVLTITDGATGGLYQFGLNKDGIEIVKPLKFKPFIIINYTDIEDIEVSIVDKNSTKDKSVIGRALVGGLIAGSLGAIVAGMSGTGDKSIKELDLEIIIKIKDKNDIKLEGKNIKGDNINKAKTFIKFLQYNLSEEEDTENNLF